MIDWIARPDRQNVSGISSLTGPVDVVVINELVRNKPRKTLLRGPNPGLGQKRKGGLVRKYNYEKTDKEEPNKTFYLTSGGIMILSQYNIKESNYKAFPKSAVRDISLAHGIVHAEVEKNGETYNIFATHFDTDGGPTDCSGQKKGWNSFQKSEVEHLRTFVEKHAGNEPAIMAGDFNIGVGLQRCGAVNQQFYKHTLQKLGAVEPVHPEDTEGGKDFPSRSNDQGRVLDHIMVRNFPLSHQSFAKRLRFKASSSNVGVRGDNLSDHHPVYAFLQQCDLPSISQTQTRVSAATNNPSQQQGGYPIAPTLQIELSNVPSCAGSHTPVHWEVATDSDFNNVVYTESTNASHSSQKASASITPALRPSTRYYWRAYLGPKRHWPPTDSHAQGVWDPSHSPSRQSQTESFETFDPETDRYEDNPTDNDKKGRAVHIARQEWEHKGMHMVCPNGAGLVPTKTSGGCDGIFTTTKDPGPNAPLVAFERWRLNVSDLSLNEGDVDYFEVELPDLDVETTNQSADQTLENDPCATLRLWNTANIQTNREIRSDPTYKAYARPRANSIGKYELNDPQNVHKEVPHIECSSWGNQGPKIVRIGKEDGQHWGGYELELELEIRMVHKDYERAAAVKAAAWRDAAEAQRLQFIRDLTGGCSRGWGCQLEFPAVVNERPDGAIGPPGCRRCQQGMPLQVGKASPFEMTVQVPPALDLSLIDINGTVVARARPTDGATGARPTEMMAMKKSESEAPNPSSSQTRVQKRLSVDELDPGAYLLVVEGPPSILTIEDVSLPQQRSVDDEPAQPTIQSGGIQVTALPKAGAFLSGVSTFEDISGATSSALGGAQSVFTWGGSLAFGARNGPVNMRLTGLRTTGSLVSTTEGIESSQGPVREKMTLLTGDVVVRPIPRMGIQPYAIGGLGARRLSVRRFDELSGGPQWDLAAQVGVGFDFRLGSVTLGVEVADYLTGITGGSGNDLQHDAFGFVTLGIPIFRMGGTDGEGGDDQSVVPEPRDEVDSQPGISADLNDGLDELARDMALFLAEESNRSFLQSQVSESSNAEQIIGLQPFLERAADQQLGEAETLSRQASQLRGQLKKTKARPPEEEGPRVTMPEGLKARFDLYFPVREHREQWQGGKDLIVAPVPVRVEDDLEEITGFTLSGEEVSLSADRIPQRPVLVIAAEEHLTHETRPIETREQPPEEPEEGEPEPDERHSSLGIPWVKLWDDHEGWFQGEPELHLQMWEGSWRSPSHAQNWPLHEVDDEETWYSLGDHGPIYWYWDESRNSRYELIFYEVDPRTRNEYPGTGRVNRSRIEWQGYKIKRFDDVDFYIDKDHRDP
jgi:endonuclease/exonuclease/phosphatase family metal-dependent hydrolase